MGRIPLIVGAAASLAAHLFLGWTYSVVGPLLAGLMAGKRPGVAGLSAQVLAWGTLMAWNVAVAPQESLNMMETLGSLLGGMPAFVTPLLTLLMAALTGLAAGWLGGSLKRRNVPDKP